MIWLNCLNEVIYCIRWQSYMTMLLQLFLLYNVSFNKHIARYGNKRIYRCSVAIAVDKKTSKILARDDRRKPVDLLIKKPPNF